MSGKLVFAALEAELPDHLAKLVLIVVCDHYNESQGYAWPSVETIARKCCCSERSVRNKLRLLEDLGLIETMQSDGNTNRYKVSYSQGAANGAGLHLVPVGAANDAPITSYEPLTKKRVKSKQIKLVDWEPCEKAKAYAAERNLNANEIWEDMKLWNAANGDRKACESPLAFWQMWCRKEAKKRPAVQYKRNGGVAEFNPGIKKEFTKDEWAKLKPSMQKHYDQQRPAANPYYRERFDR